MRHHGIFTSREQKTWRRRPLEYQQRASHPQLGLVLSGQQPVATKSSAHLRAGINAGQESNYNIHYSMMCPSSARDPTVPLQSQRPIIHSMSQILFITLSYTGPLWLTASTENQGWKTVQWYAGASNPTLLHFNMCRPLGRS